MLLYTRLSEGAVRLLRLLPDPEKHSDIKCHLFTCNLLESGSTHPYEALSYVWGPEDNQKSIYIDNCKLSVRTNLHSALSDLRDEYMDRIIWIDAICINQEDNDEKGQQVQSMAKIYAKASRVIIWLGEAAENSDQALKAIHKAAEEKREGSTIDKTNKQAILTLLSRPWFQRVWEVAAAQHILIKCGPAEINGYVFSVGLSALELSYETRPDLQDLIPPIVYLIEGAAFWPRYEASRPGRFYLHTRPLGELVDMFHTRKATLRLDKFYALLGMSSDDPSTAGLLANYEASWKLVFQKFVQFFLSNRMSVDTWDEKEVAVIRGKGLVLGEVSSANSEGRGQSVDITWKNPFDTKWKQRSYFFQASAKPIQVGDAVCLLQGASRPTIIRLFYGYSAVIMIAVPLAGMKWSELFRSITTFSNDLLLVWDWSASGGKLQDREDYEHLICNRGPKCPRTGCQCEDCLDNATRLWNLGLVLQGMGRHGDAGKHLRKAVDVWREADIEGVRAMVDLLIKDKGGSTTTSLSTREGYEEIVRLLLATGKVDLDSSNVCGPTPLWWAIQRGYTAVVQLLLEKGANVDVKDSDRTPLQYFARDGHEALVRLLVKKGADINAEHSPRSPLSYAAENGHEAIAQLLLESGADVDVNAKGNYYKLPLSYAAENGHEAIVRLLVKKGADINAEHSPRSPLSYAAENGHGAVARLLLESGADVNVDARGDYNRRPLSYAAENGHEAVVRLLLEKGANINAEHSPRSPLSYAAENGHEAVVWLLLEKGANISTEGDFGRTPLRYAAQNGHEAVVRLLLEKGAEVNDEGPLIWAAGKRHWAVVQLLLEKGANIDTKGGFGLTLLQHVAWNGHETVLRLLLEKGADVDAKGDSRRTLLSYAAENGQEAVVRLLVEKGANINTKGDSGQTPLQYAAENGHEIVAQFLKSHQAHY